MDGDEGLNNVHDITAALDSARLLVSTYAARVEGELAESVALQSDYRAQAHLATESLQTALAANRKLEAECTLAAATVAELDARIKGHIEEDRAFKKVSRVVALEKENAELRRLASTVKAESTKVEPTKVEPTKAEPNADLQRVNDELREEIQMLTSLLRSKK